MTTTVDDVEQRLRAALDQTIPLLLAGQRSTAASSEMDRAAEAIAPNLEPDELDASRLSTRRRTMLTAAVLLLLAGTGGLIATQDNPGTPATTNSPASTEPTATTQPAETALQTVLDLLPGATWVGITMTPDALALSAFDTAGRRVWFSYAESLERLVQGDAGTKMCAMTPSAMAVAVGCDTAGEHQHRDLGLPVFTEDGLTAAASALLPLLRGGTDGILGDLVTSHAFTVDKIEADQMLAQALDDESAKVNVDAGVVSKLPIGVPLPFTAPDGSSVISRRPLGVLYRVRTGPATDVANVIQTIPALLGLASSGDGPPMTTLPTEQP